MIESPIRLEFKDAIREYQGKGSISYLVKALCALDKSTPPTDVDERVSWINDLIGSYREVSKAFREEIPATQEELQEEIGKADRRDVEADLEGFREELKSAKYGDAADTLSNLLKDINNASGKNLEYAADILKAYSEFAKKASKRIIQANNEISGLKDELKETKSDLEYTEEKQDEELRKIGED